MRSRSRTICELIRRSARRWQGEGANRRRYASASRRPTTSHDSSCLRARGHPVQATAAFTIDPRDLPATYVAESPRGEMFGFLTYYALRRSRRADCRLPTSPLLAERILRRFGSRQMRCSGAGIESGPHKSPRRGVN